LNDSWPPCGSGGVDDIGLLVACGHSSEPTGPDVVTGWLLYDSPHKGDSGRSTPWEVHPITRIEVCCWRELG
jgi:hypothetical protein